MQSIRYVVTLHDFGHFGMAAKFLNLSQPALSRSISALEEKLGARLFDRKTKPLKATEFGRFFLERAIPLLASADDFAKQLSEAGGITYPTLRIGCGPYPAETIVTSAIQHFSQRHALVRLELKIRSAEELVPLLNNDDKLNFFIAEISMLSQFRNLVVVPLGKPAVALLVRAGHPILSKRVDLETIFRFPLLVSHPIPVRLMNPILDIWKNIPEQERPPIPAIECSSVSIAKRLILETDMIGAMPLSSAISEIESGEIRPISAEPWMHLNYGIVYLKDQPLNEHAKAFIEILKEKQFAMDMQEERLYKRFFK
ncbi:MAG: LysR family transcriptional regulator [Arenimonas sp.]|nr:LysR family transcriptional regulator [Arenimonas sp.]MBP7369990.1 LysR family transcriptional regulator [Arenimonas sp.]